MYKPESASPEHPDRAQPGDPEPSERPRLAETLVPKEPGEILSGEIGPSEVLVTAAPDAMPSLPFRGLPPAGQRIGQYELIRELGRGGMGAVYLARDTKLGRRVAIKFLRSAQPEQTARFLLEARATARCQHENIVVIHDVGEHDGHPFMVLEYLRGTPLSKLLDSERKMPANRAVELMVPVVRALVRAHEHQIVHRDLKPDNILVSESGTVKVLDFGIAKLVQEPFPLEAVKDELSGKNAAPNLAAAELSIPPSLAEDSDPWLTQQGMLLGTLPYMSPEQWGADTVDHRTDVWAVGIMLFQMVAGQHPLGSAQGRQLMITGLLNEPMPGIRTVCPELADELADIIDSCLVKPKHDRMGSARDLLEALEPLLPGRYTRRLRINQSPYAGLNAFQEADADRFFGRTDEIAAAVARLRDQPLLGIVGPSGVGKSSFVRAGLVPGLKQSGESWTALVARPGRQPMAALAQVVVGLVGESSSSAVSQDLLEHEAVLDRLVTEPGFLGVVLRSRARKQSQRILLFIDQFEELYTLGADQDQRKAFTTCLASLADDATAPLRVVLSLRSDFLDRVPEDKHFMAELAQGLFFLTHPAQESMREALVKPAEMAGFQFESPDMVEHMLEHLGHTSGGLPLLQFAASQLWEARDTEQKLLTEESYRALGGIAGALASHADSVVAEFPAHDQHWIRAIFQRLITPERTRAIVSTRELYELSRNPGDIQRLVDRLVRARLLVIRTDESGSGALVEIVHESLIHSWPLLRRWLDENQDDAAFLEQLRTAAKQWRARGYPNGLLWRGEAMEEARRWARRYRGDLPDLQRAYLSAVISFATRNDRRKRRAVAIAFALLSLLVVAACIGLILIRDAERESTRQAARAKEVGKELEAQLTQTETARQQLETAKQQVTRQRDEAERANQELASTNQQLEATTEELSIALKQAKRAKRRARRQRDIARAAVEVARLAKEEAQQRAEQARNAFEEVRLLLRRTRAQLSTSKRRRKPLIRDIDEKK